MGRIAGRMRAAIDEDWPVERSHVLKMVRTHLARQRILLGEDASAADTAPLMRQRMRTALIFRRIVCAACEVNFY